MSMEKMLIYVVMALDFRNMGKIVFNPVKDIQDVDQFGFVDLIQVVSNGVVPSALKIEDTAFNNIEDPASIIGKPRDTFEALAMASIISERGRKTPES